MRASSLLIAVLVTCTLAAIALGDLLPFPGPRPTPRPTPPPPYRQPVSPRVVLPERPQPSPDSPAETWLPTLDEDTHVELRTADVDVHLARSPEKGSRRTKAKQVLAHVRCRFDLSCISARKPRTTFAVAFPIAPSESRGLKVTGFTASVDGEKLNRFGVNRWNLVDEDGEERSYYGYTWPTTIGRKADQVVTVEYTVLLPVRDNASSFTYVLRSGAAWHGLIGQETIRVTAEPGIHIRPGDSGSLRPAEQADRKIVWEIKDTDPADDVRVAILLEPVEGVARAPE